MGVAEHLHRAPWFAKLAGKLVLARLPVRYDRWAAMGIFKHGPMADPDYAVRVLQQHLTRLGREDLSGLTVLELGPGDSVATAQIARALGAAHTYLVDTGTFARQDDEPYRRTSDRLESLGLSRQGDTYSAALTDATYMTRGLHSLREIPDGTIDIVVSQAVLEHVRLAEFQPMLNELRRVTSPSGAHSHVVDLRDHLGESLHNLRFPRRIWESELFSSSGFYTNRIRYSKMLQLFREAGFDVESEPDEVWPSVPLRRRSLRTEFRDLESDDLCVKTFAAVLR